MTKETCDHDNLLAEEVITKGYSSIKQDASYWRLTVEEQDFFGREYKCQKCGMKLWISIMHRRGE